MSRPSSANRSRPPRAGAARDAAASAAYRLRLNTLDRLSPRTQQALASIAYTRSWRDGDVIHAAGDMASSALVCDSGRIRFSRVSIHGSESLRRWIGVGELIGIAFVIAACPFDFSITADGPCRTTHFPAAQLRELMRSDGELASELAEFLARRILELSDVVVEEAGEPLGLRLYYTLVRLCKVDEGIRRADGHELRISQSDLASMVGSSREYVNPLLRRMQEQGLIRIGYRSIVLLDGHAERARRLHGDYP